jgi:hypothetical protein
LAEAETSSQPADKGKFNRAHVTDKAREKLPFERKIILIIRLKFVPKLLCFIDRYSFHFSFDALIPDF